MPRIPQDNLPIGRDINGAIISFDKQDNSRLRYCTTKVQYLV